MSTDATKLENEMSIIRDPDDQTRQMKVGPSGQIFSQSLTDAVDSTGTYYFPINTCSDVITYNADSTINTWTKTDPITGFSFRRTYTYTGGLLTSMTAWVKQ